MVELPNLKQTEDFMNSSDYKERFVGEYWQTKIRYEKLKNFNNRIEASSIVDIIIEPKHDCPAHLLKHQQSAMGEYLHILEVRAVIENVDLDMIFKPRLCECKG